MKQKNNERTGHTAGFDPRSVNKRKNRAAGSFQNRLRRSMHGNSPLHTLAEEEEVEEEFEFDPAAMEVNTPL
jgi:hypothetical protein